METSIDDMVRKLVEAKTTIGCWIWNGQMIGRHPAFSTAPLRGKMVRRYVYVAYGNQPPLAPEDGVKNTCGEARCINPAHMVHNGAKRGRPLGQKGKPKPKPKGGRRAKSG